MSGADRPHPALLPVWAAEERTEHPAAEADRGAAASDQLNQHVCFQHVMGPGDRSGRPRSTTHQLPINYRKHRVFSILQVLMPTRVPVCQLPAESSLQILGSVLPAAWINFLLTEVRNLFSITYMHRACVPTVAGQLSVGRSAAGTRARRPLAASGSNRPRASDLHSRFFAMGSSTWTGGV